MEPLRATHSAAAARGLAGGLVVTSGSFSAEAMKFAEGRHLHLIGGRRLSELLGTVRDVGDVHSQTTQPAPMSMLTPLDRRFPPVPPAEGDHAR